MKCANNFFDERLKKYKPGKRYQIGKYEIIDHITTSSNQIIYELDAKSYARNYELAKKIIVVLENMKISYCIFQSSLKGIHIETWFNHLVLKNIEIIELYKEALSYGLSYKHIRLWMWNKVLDEANIPETMRGSGKIVDDSCMQFNDLLDKTRLLRCCGGRKQVYDKVTDKTEVYYKTFLTKDNFKNRPIKIKNINEVVYPNEISTFIIDENELAAYLEDFVTQQQALNIEKSVNLPSTSIGGYINLDAVKTIREGLKEGNRAFGAQILAIAMANDEMNMDTQVKVMEEYAINSSQIGHTFDVGEAVNWIHWMKHQKFIFWNCKLLDRLDVHIKNQCAFCKEKNKDALKLLSQTTLLNKIKEVLDVEVVGEDETKMLVFLLSLSKDFPSKTGNPGWNIFGDPMSQNIILCSDSSSGKTWITKKVLELFGEEDKDYFIVSRYSKNALNYYNEINMDNKIIFIEEMQGLDDNTAQIRVWMSEGKLSLTSVEKVKNGEGIEVNALVKKTTQGQPVFISNQAEGLVEDQINNRSWVLDTDVSMSQTTKILDFQDNIHKGNIQKIEEKKREIRDALQQLEPYHFIVPYADWRLLNIPVKDVRSRRDYQKFITLIKCSAYLHQKQRHIIKDLQDNEYLVCSLQDYEIAVKYSSGILGATFSGLTNQQIDTLNFIKSQDWKLEFQISDLMANLGKSQPYWYGQLKQLSNLGYLVETRSGGKATDYRIVLDKALSIINMPSTDEIMAKLQDPNLLQLLQLISGNFTGTLENLNMKKKSVIAVIGAKPHISSRNDEKTQKIAPINHDTLHKSCIFSDPKKLSGSAKGTRIIGAISRIDIINYYKTHNSHWVPIEHIIKKFGEDNKEVVKNILSDMSAAGSIILKEGKVMYL